jgi:hypothetical protein
MRKMTHHTVVAATQLLVSAVMTLMMTVALDVVIVTVGVIAMMSLVVLVDMMDVEATVVLSLAAV